mmetsp:Transcript_19157/g.48453  ORF Transcript_19157/g.48453 Transcript_19157/m.48453 type:complete len:303 (-) Transcript_19157:251-1159(-)
MRRRPLATAPPRAPGVREGSPTKRVAASASSVHATRNFWPTHCPAPRAGGAAPLCAGRRGASQYESVGRDEKRGPSTYLGARTPLARDVPSPTGKVPQDWPSRRFTVSKARRAGGKLRQRPRAPCAGRYLVYSSSPTAPSSKSLANWPARSCGSLPFLFLSLGLAPLARSHWMMSLKRLLQAMCSAVFPLPSCRLTSAPDRASFCTIDRWPSFAALCRAEAPALLVASTTEPAPRRLSTGSSTPRSAAKCNGQFPALSVAFTFAPAAMSLVSTSSRSWLQAWCSMVMPPKPALSSSAPRSSK